MANLKFVKDHNESVYLEDHPQHHNIFRLMLVGLRASRIFHAISQHPDICEDFIRDFWSTADFVTENEVEGIVGTVAGKRIVVTDAVIRECLNFGDEAEYATRRKGGYDELSANMTATVYALVTRENFNFSRVVFEEMKSNLTGKKKASHDTKETTCESNRQEHFVLHEYEQEREFSESDSTRKVWSLSWKVHNHNLSHNHKHNHNHNNNHHHHHNLDRLKIKLRFQLLMSLGENIESQGTSGENVEEKESESKGDSEVKRKAAGKPPLINPSEQQSDTFNEDYDFEADLGLRKKEKVSQQLPQKSTPIITPIITKQQYKGKAKVVNQLAPVDVQALQQRVFVLEQDSAAKDSKINKLNAENDTLRTTINIQSGQIKSLKENMVYVLKELKRLKEKKDKRKRKKEDRCSGNGDDKGDDNDGDGDDIEGKSDDKDQNKDQGDQPEGTSSQEDLSRAMVVYVPASEDKGAQQSENDFSFDFEQVLDDLLKSDSMFSFENDSTVLDDVFTGEEMFEGEDFFDAIMPTSPTYISAQGKVITVIDSDVFAEGNSPPHVESFAEHVAESTSIPEATSSSTVLHKKKSMFKIIPPHEVHYVTSSNMLSNKYDRSHILSWMFDNEKILYLIKRKNGRI
ncbi:hypothetical protein L1987_21284 [Smallanthus sonchifolius]|uniref:Uncharacterized protein n=1 Tax=Smallanthus sonchifolius TaxID=185202 RepID=A0ACB9IU62_9ASTR|nr:hypothetical protein L1987_21284 [Smallanthus sonchifolius]